MNRLCVMKPPSDAEHEAGVSSTERPDLRPIQSVPVADRCCVHEAFRLFGPQTPDRFPLRGAMHRPNVRTGPGGILIHVSCAHRPISRRDFLADTSTSPGSSGQPGPLPPRPLTANGRAIPAMLRNGGVTEKRPHHFRDGITGSDSVSDLRPAGCCTPCGRLAGCPGCRRRPRSGG